MCEKLFKEYVAYRSGSSDPSRGFSLNQIIDFA